MKKGWDGPLEKVGDFRWQIPRSYDQRMRVAGLIYADEDLLTQIRGDQAPQQVANVAHLPGIVGSSMGMPDIHWGYGFCIGGVAGMDVESGVISPGGVGYDINCGVRVLRTDLRLDDVEPHMPQLVDSLYNHVPCGVGSKGKIRISEKEVEKVLSRGARWAVENGYGWQEDLTYTEEEGAIDGADPSRVSPRALSRGRPQLGTLGAGNHFLEIQIIEDVYRDEVAGVLGLEAGRISVMIHSGSRGLGYQVCDDYVKSMGAAVRRYGIDLPDRQLACAPVESPEGRAYLAAMRCAANYAWANRQCIMHWVREAFEEVLGRSAEDLGMHLIYDVAHNIAKFERHLVDGEERTLCVHRKGATRAFPPGHRDVPQRYRSIGQPVLIPGDMGTSSYVLVGTDRAMEETFGSTCHGAGRVMSRTAAIKATAGRAIEREMAERGVVVRAREIKTLREEVPEAYKDVDRVVDIVEGAGISHKVVRMRPLGVVKG
ncbi:tRNA-splicing ligase [candidate division TA06 bacterium DG_24]|jgi:tRNA-splicing ligase RtcB|uniref:tRNA-splicing ligase RtcB n=2 Tax=Bacteria division TA06 TaxID=1156500 RepID=A0A0S8JMS9_UNCT6|nr:MAG: tRNA-splicing ligase [candidate division TA06 bacterium DG_24]KPL10124.1 MAG: tRNA-splicing ligase [candidate division TA06 bacterium SM1_40]